MIIGLNNKRLKAQNLRGFFGAGYDWPQKNGAGYD
jgi:hypothetical protein